MLLGQGTLIICNDQIQTLHPRDEDLSQALFNPILHSLPEPSFKGDPGYSGIPITMLSLGHILGRIGLPIFLVRQDPHPRPTSWRMGVIDLLRLCFPLNQWSSWQGAIPWGPPEVRFVEDMSYSFTGYVGALIWAFWTETWWDKTTCKGTWLFELLGPALDIFMDDWLE